MSSGAEAINNNGPVVGWAMTAGPIPNQDGEIHAFLYDGAMHDLSSMLGAGASHAYGINSLGAIVGDAFLLEDGKVIDLNNLLPADSDRGGSAGAFGCVRRPGPGGHGSDEGPFGPTTAHFRIATSSAMIRLSVSLSRRYS